jgi:hypothetical protein
VTAGPAAGAAGTAAAACRGAARALHADADDRAVVAAAARDGWEGPYRRTFDDEAATLAARADRLAVAALALARALDDAVELRAAGGW